MGQRSQIYVRVNRVDGRKYLFPRYYQWNYAERMVSRTKGIIEWLQEYATTPDYLAGNPEMQEKMIRIMDTNFDYRDIVLGRDIIKGYYEAREWQREHGETPSDFEQIVFAGQANNDGQVFIDLITDFDHKDKKGDFKYTFKYGFRTYADDDWKAMDPEQYMDWDYEDWRTCESMKDCVKLTVRNINWIRKHAKLMTEDEMFEFAHHDYVKDMGLEESK